MPPLRRIFWLSLLFVSGPAAAWAHDPLQGMTALWLRPDGLELEFTLALAPARRLADNIPNAPITDENFASDYHALLQERAPNFFVVTSNGEALKPRTIDIAFTDELDIRIDYIYPAPAEGPLRVTATFFPKTEQGFLNNIVAMRERKTIGFGEQSAETPDFEVNLRNGPIKPAAELSPPAALKPASLPTDAGQHDSYFIVPHLGKALLGGVVLVIVVWVIWRVKQKGRRR